MGTSQANLPNTRRKANKSPFSKQSDSVEKPPVLSGNPVPNAAIRTGYDFKSQIPRRFDWESKTDGNGRSARTPRSEGGSLSDSGCAREFTFGVATCRRVGRGNTAAPAACPDSESGTRPTRPDGPAGASHYRGRRRARSGAPHLCSGRGEGAVVDVGVGGGDEGFEQRMRRVGLALELGMELRGNKEWMIF